MSFGRNLKQLRRHANLTQAELAKKSGLDNMTISHYENDRRVPGVNNLKKLAEALGCDFGDFLK